MMSFDLKNVLCVLSSSLLLMACGQKDNHQQNSQNQSNSSMPVYRVATDATRPPFEFIENEQIIGMDIDLLKAIAANRGFQVEFYHVKRDDFFKEFDEKRADLGIAALTNNQATRQHLNLSDDYFESPYRIAALKPEFLKNQTWKQKNIAVVKHENTIDALQNHFAIDEKRLLRVETPYLGLSAVAKGEADVFIGDSAMILYYMNSPTFQKADYYFTTEVLPTPNENATKLVIGVQKDNQDLLDRINTGLYSLKQSGEYSKIQEKWRQK